MATAEEETVQLIDEFSTCLQKDFVNSRTLLKELENYIPSINTQRDLLTLFGKPNSSAADMMIWNREHPMVELIKHEKRNEDSVTLAMFLDIIKHPMSGVAALAINIRKKSPQILEETRAAEERRRNPQIVSQVHTSIIDRNRIEFHAVIEAPLTNLRSVNVIYHNDQLSAERIDYFVRQMNEVFRGQIEFFKYDLHEKNFDTIRSLFPINKPVVVIYDSDLHQTILNVDNNINASDDKQLKLRFFYHLVFDQYCRSEFKNKFVFPFCLDDFDTKYKEGNHFKYFWLLQFLEAQPNNGKLKVAKFKRIPEIADNGVSPQEERKFKDELNDFKTKFSSKLIET